VIALLAIAGCSASDGSIRAKAAPDTALLQKGQPARILALGDSITRGSGDGYGNYRRPLQALLSKQGYDFSFVGSNTKQSDNYHGSDPEQQFSPYQPKHEGYGGFRIDQIGADLPGTDDGGANYSGLIHVLNTETPDVVLVMLGTNDINQGFDPAGGAGYGGEVGMAANAAARLDKLVGRIHELRPEITLALGTITPLRDAAKQAKVKKYNALIPRIVADHQKKGEKIVLADMGAAIEDADITSDGVHPTTLGYDKMARVWFTALTGEKAAPLPASVPVTMGQIAAPNLFKPSNTVLASAAFAPAFVPAQLVDGTSKAWVFAGAKQQLVSVSGFKGAIGRLRFFNTPSYTGRTSQKVTIYASSARKNSLKPGDYTKIGAFSLPVEGDNYKNPTNPVVYAEMSEPAARPNAAISYSDLDGLKIPAGTQSLLFDFSKSGDDGDGLTEIQAFAPPTQ